MNRAHLRDVLALLALVVLAGLTLRCGPLFTNGIADVDAGDLLEGGDVLEVRDAGGELAEVLDVHQGDAGDVHQVDAHQVDAGEVLDAGDELHQVDAGAPDVAPPPHDAAPPPVDAAPDAPALCCHITCGTGTLPPGSGWICVSGKCGPGDQCSFMNTCGVIVTCPG